MKVNEIFSSIQGEGKYAGHPALFIRLSGCNRECDFCDTKYHKNGREYKNSELVDIIYNKKQKIIVWTGGEPLIQIDEIEKVIFETKNDVEHHLETNGDIVKGYDNFDFISISPKCLETAANVSKFAGDTIDIKVVTDLEMNKELIQYATILMPLTTSDKVRNLDIEQKVWNYCTENKIRYGLRQHVHVWGLKKGV